MAKDRFARITQTLTPYEKKPAIRFLDANGQRTTVLAIANFMEGSVKSSSQIGFEKDGVKYLFIQKKVEAKAIELRRAQVPETEIYQKILADETLYKKMPENYSDAYEIKSTSKIIYSSGKFDPSKSNDKFYVEYEDLTLVDQSSIDVIINTGKDSSKVTLYPAEGRTGVFRSKELLLVPNRTVDKNPKTDQTIVANVGDLVEVVYQGNDQQTHVAWADVPVKKVLPIQFVILKNDKGEAMATPEDVKRHLEFAQASLNYTQTKIENLDIVYYQPPADSGVLIDDGLNNIEKMIIADLTREYIPKTKVQVILSNNIGVTEVGNPIEGDAFSERKFGNLETYNVVNTVFIRTGADRLTLGHELGHIVFGALNEKDYNKLKMDNEGHSDKLLDLMFLGAASEREDNMFHPAQYLTDAEIKAFQSSPLLIDPPEKQKIPITTEYREGLRLVPRP